MSVTVDKAPPGVFDILPISDEMWRSSHLWRYVEDKARSAAGLFGFEEVRTPIFEKESLFRRNVGEETDIVSKEMYCFVDRGDRHLALRPEGTAPVMRAFVEHHLDQKGPFHKLFYLAPMFRYERAQAGRYRQHHQFGVEAIGVCSALQDAEVIALLWRFLSDLKLEGLQLHINSLGSREEYLEYRNCLVDYLQQHKQRLSADSQRRLEVNPVRILDSKDPSDQEILQRAPLLFHTLGKESRAHFDAVCRLLDAIGISYSHHQRLVRGLDYYNGVVFEVTSAALGAQNSLGGGGRYDGMLRGMGGADLPSMGFGAGLERIIQALIAQGKAPSKTAVALLYLIPLGDAAREWCFTQMDRLRMAGIPVQMELGDRKLARAMQWADGAGVQFVAVVGDDELKGEMLRLKEMASGVLRTVPLNEEFIAEMQSHLDSKIT